MGLVTLRHVGSSQTRAQTHVPCIGRWILNHCTTREAPVKAILMWSHYLNLFEFAPDKWKRFLKLKITCWGKWYVSLSVHYMYCILFLLWSWRGMSENHLCALKCSWYLIMALEILMQVLLPLWLPALAGRRQMVFCHELSFLSPFPLRSPRFINPFFSVSGYQKLNSTHYI